MALPDYVTDTLSDIGGEYGNSIVDLANTDISIYPAELLSALPTELPSFSPFKKELLQTILGETGRSELFQNKFSDDIDSIQSDLTRLAATEPTLAAACTDCLESLGEFESHIDRLSGLTEPTDANTAALPTLEKALAVGSSLNYYHQAMDSAPSNLPALSMFSAFFVGDSAIAQLKSVLAGATSSLSANTILNFSSVLVDSVTADVNSYYSGVKKLKRLSVGNDVFSGKDKVVDSHLLDNFIATDYLKSLLNGEISAKNLEAAAKTRDRLAEEAKSYRKSSQSFGRDFNSVADLLKADGLGFGIPMSKNVLLKLRELHPANQPGILNAYLRDNASFADLDNLTEEQISVMYAPKADAFGKTRFTAIGSLLQVISDDWLSRTIGGSRSFYDPYVDIALPLGGINLWLIKTLTRREIKPLNDYVGPVILGGDITPDRRPNPSELEDIKRVLLSRRASGAFSNFSQFSIVVYGYPFQALDWVGQYQS